MSHPTNNTENFRIEAIHAAPIGGQHVGNYLVDIKITHIPTGIYAVCGSERSQHKNRNIAMRMVEYGLAEMGWKKE